MAKAKYGRVTTNLKRNGVYYAKDQTVKLEWLDEETMKFVEPIAVMEDLPEEETAPRTPPSAKPSKKPKETAVQKLPEVPAEKAPEEPTKEKDPQQPAKQPEQEKPNYRRMKKEDLLAKLAELGVKDVDPTATNDTLADLIESFDA